MIELILPAFALVQQIIEAANAHSRGEASDEQIEMLRRISDQKVNDAVAAIDAALARSGEPPVEPPLGIS